MVVGLSSTLPGAVRSGLVAHGLAAGSAQHVAQLPPVSILFAAFLGYNPIQHFVGAHALAALGAHDRAIVTGRSFFPHLISGPFHTGLHLAFAFAIVACLIAAVASAMRGARYEHVDEQEPHSAQDRLASATPQPRAPRPQEQHAS
jgi:hypothetical protein